MAKRTQRVGPNAAATGAGGSANAGDAVRTASAENDTGHAANFVVFDLAGGKFGFQLGDVGEIIRVPNLARMPLAPQSLIGLANLHGVVLPVVDLRRLLGLPGAPLDEAARVIVIARGAPVGYVVDRIDGLVALPAGRLEKDDAGAGSIDPELLDGVIKGAEGESTVKILNPIRILRDEFSRLGASGQRASRVASVAAVSATPSATAVERKVSLVSFELGGQEYALPLDRVQEIIQLPDHISEVARSETAVLGVVTLRDRLLPLVSLRALLGLPADSGREEPGKVVVLPMGGGAVGVVADRTREIIHVDPGAIDAAPSLLTRGEGDAEITSICRLDNGKRLVAVLSPDRLFRSELVRRVLSEQGQQIDAEASRTEEDSNGRRAIHYLPARRSGLRIADRSGGRDRPAAGAHRPPAQGSGLRRWRDEPARRRGPDYRSAAPVRDRVRTERRPAASAFSLWRLAARRRVSWSTAYRRS